MKKADRFLAKAKQAGYDIPKSYLTKYELPKYQDFVILGKCLQALKKKLSKADRKQVRFIMSQLLKKWRPPLEKGTTTCGFISTHLVISPSFIPDTQIVSELVIASAQFI